MSRRVLDIPPVFKSPVDAPGHVMVTVTGPGGKSVSMPLVKWLEKNR